MKILFVTSKSLGGSGKYIEVLADGLRSKGVECDLLYYPRGVDQDSHIESAFRKVYHFDFEPSFSPFRAIANLNRVISTIENEEYDWVHSHTSMGGFYGRIGYSLSKTQSKMAHTLHAFGADEFTPIPQKWIFWVIERGLDLITDIYFCPSYYMKEFGRKTKVINSDKCRIVYNSLPLPVVDQRVVRDDALTTKLSISNEVILLFCGRIERQKGVDVLIDAVSRVDSNCKFKLLICGEGADMPSLKKLVISLGLADKIIWLGWQVDLEPFYALADIYIMPSRWESFGLVFLEAMNHSLPILSTGVQAIPEVVTDNEVGLLSDSEDALGLAKNIEKLVNDDVLRGKYGLAAKARLKTKFSFQDFVSGHFDVYQS